MDVVINPMDDGRWAASQPPHAAGTAQPAHDGIVEVKARSRVPVLGQGTDNVLAIDVSTLALAVVKESTRTPAAANEDHSTLGGSRGGNHFDQHILVSYARACHRERIADAAEAGGRTINDGRVGHRPQRIAADVKNR